MDRQVCMIKTVAYSLQTDRLTEIHTDRQTERQTHAWPDKKVKTEGPKILSNDIFYFRTVIIDGPKRKNKQAQLRAEADRLGCFKQYRCMNLRQSAPW